MVLPLSSLPRHPLRINALLPSAQLPLRGIGSDSAATGSDRPHSKRPPKSHFPRDSRGFSASADRRRLLAPLHASMATADPPPRGEAAPALKQSASIDRIPVDERRILHRLARGPLGRRRGPRRAGRVPAQGAMTNEGNGPHKVLVRIYGRGVEVFFDRADEVRTFECMSCHEQGPRLLGRFANGRVEEFINAKVHYASTTLNV
jgi:hypothetical protein